MFAFAFAPLAGCASMRPPLDADAASVASAPPPPPAIQRCADWKSTSTRKAWPTPDELLAVLSTTTTSPEVDRLRALFGEPTLVSFGDPLLAFVDAGIGL